MDLGSFRPERSSRFDPPTTAGTMLHARRDRARSGRAKPCTQKRPRDLGISGHHRFREREPEKETEQRNLDHSIPLHRRRVSRILREMTSCGNEKNLIESLTRYKRSVIRD